MNRGHRKFITICERPGIPGSLCLIISLLVVGDFGQAAMVSFGVSNFLRYLFAIFVVIGVLSLLHNVAVLSRLNGTSE